MTANSSVATVSTLTADTTATLAAAAQGVNVCFNNPVSITRGMLRFDVNQLHGYYFWFISLSYYLSPT